LREARPRDINDAETHAVRLETYSIADRQRTRGRNEQTINHLTGIKPQTSENNGEQDLAESLTTELNGFKRELGSLIKEIKKFM